MIGRYFFGFVPTPRLAELLEELAISDADVQPELVVKKVHSRQITTPNEFLDLAKAVYVRMFHESQFFATPQQLISIRRRIESEGFDKYWTTHFF